MKILGISCFFHDSAACLIVDGKIVGAAAEERFSRKKHDNRFPVQAIDYCLKEAKIAVNEIDKIVFYEKPIVKFERILTTHINYFPKGFSQFVSKFGEWITIRLQFKKILKSKLNYYGDVLFVDHHLSHLASSYYLSNFKSASLVSIDGVGEWNTVSVGSGSQKNINILQTINFPHSLGLLYSAITTYLGFSANNSEYKVMGLAAFGDSSKFKKQFEELVSIYNDGSFSLNMEYFDFGWSKKRMYSKKLVKLFGFSPRKKNDRVLARHQDIAAALQAKLEEASLSLLNSVYDKQQNSNLCLAGGVMLNSVLNGKLLAKTKFKKFFIPPDPSDAGGAMGAALYIANHFGDLNRAKVAKSFSTYLGPDFKHFQIEKTLNQYKLSKKIKFQYIKHKQDLIAKSVSFLDSQKVIGWFQGRMEWGPRALGNRSILASARSEKMRDLINKKIKKREMFRPFAPVILTSQVDKYFDLDNKTKQNFSFANKWMLTVYPFKEKAKSKVPAVVHVDGSGRLESLDRTDNPLYFDLLNSYHKKTGVPIIINTSFNVRGEPIVCTPKDAVECFLNTDLDYLIIDQFIVRKA